MEKEWPRLKKCPQYKYGMLHPYMNKFYWEDVEHSDEIQYYYSDDNEEDENRNVVAFKPRDLKTFLEQVRNSRGYDVDRRPPSCMESPFWPVKPGTYEVIISKSVEVAIEHITTKTGKPYEHVKNLNALFSPNRILLLTFTAKEVAADAEPQTFLTSVFIPGHKLEDSELLECFIKPEGPAPRE